MTTVTHTPQVTVEAIAPETLHGMSMVGKTVTYNGEQFKIYSVEGYDWYAFQSPTNPTGVTCDFRMTPAEWKRQPLAFLLPMGHKIGDGAGFEVRLSTVTRGICLAKRKA